MFELNMSNAKEYANNSNHVSELHKTGLTHFAAALDFTETNYEDDGILRNSMIWYDQKYPLIRRLRKSKYWDEGALAIVKEVELSFVSSYSQKNDARTDLFNAITYNLSTDLGDDSYHNEETSKLINLYLRGRLGYDGGAFMSERLDNDEHVHFIKNVLGYERIQTGMKNSRLLQKMVASWIPDLIFGNSSESFTRRYIAWTDKMSEKKVTYKLLISVNPADYLLMSNGNSWTSCHIVNPAMNRSTDAYSGMYRSGTMSYLLDGETLVASLVKNDVENEVASYEPKIIRQLLFINKDHSRFFQSRMYPTSDNENYGELIKVHAQELIEEIFETSGKIWCTDNYFRINTFAENHYKDYEHFSNMCKSYYQGDHDDFRYSIGHEVYCLECGENIVYKSDTLYCSDCGGYDDDDYDDNDDVECHECGDWGDPNEMHCVDGAYYCDNCVGICGYCDDRYIYRDGHSTSRFGEICPWCYENNFTVCSSCERVEQHDYVFLSPDDDCLCEECFGEQVGTCDVCDDNYYYEGNDNEEEGMCPDCYKEALEEKADEKNV